MAKHRVYFAHGMESGPWGTKITALAKIAKALGCDVESPDYSGERDPDARVRRLLALQPQAEDKLILVGSSMGGYVSVAASCTLKPAGLFLLAPALYIPGFDFGGRAAAGMIEVVHGWQDDIVPVDHSIRFAREHQADLHLLVAGHTLTERMDDLTHLFSAFMERVLRQN